VSKFTLDPGKVTLYLGEVPPGERQEFAYTLRPRYPVRAQAPPAVAYEYYTPAHRAAAAPVEVVVEEAR
jgi:hypothetical protein